MYDMTFNQLLIRFRRLVYQWVDAFIHFNHQTIEISVDHGRALTYGCSIEDFAQRYFDIQDPCMAHTKVHFVYQPYLFTGGSYF